MVFRQRPITQLENFAPTTSQDEVGDALQTRAPRPKDATALPRVRIPEKRKVDDEILSQASKLPRNQSLPRSNAREEFTDAEQSGINRSYHAFMTVDQAGSVVIAHSHANPERLVAIKRIKPAKEMESFRLRPYKSDQVLSIFDAYVDGPEIVLIYEVMDITLRQMVSVCPVHTSKLSAIFKEVDNPPWKLCKEVLNTEQVVYGLNYLHQELSLIHGSLSYDSILLKQDGVVKIGVYTIMSVSSADLVSQCQRSSYRTDTVHHRECTH